MDNFLCQKIYVVTMYRWGEREGHSYVHGLFTNKELAISEGKNESTSRGGKYDYELIECIPNDPNSIKHLVCLPE